MIRPAGQLTPIRALVRIIGLFITKPPGDRLPPVTDENSNHRDPLKVEWQTIPPELDLLANPIVLTFAGKGGKRAEAGMWYAEVRKTLRGVYESVTALEKFLNQQRFNQKVSVEGAEVHISEDQRQWTIVYLTDNAIIRAVAALDKVAQMIRCYFEHPDHGGALYVLPRADRGCRRGAVLLQRAILFSISREIYFR